jgi:hypothetical protein
MLLLAIASYFILGYLRLLENIFGYFKLFHLRLFRLCEAIVGYFWLLNVISPYVVIDYSKLHYHKLLVAIGGYFICDYW